MNSVSARLVLAMTVLSALAPACASAREQADQAFMRQQWDAAAINYERAIAQANTPQEVEYLQHQLTEARTRASTAHLEEARRWMAVGDTRRAAGHAELAVKFGATGEAQALFGSLRASEGARLLEEGKAAHSGGRWTEAAAALTKAQQWAPSTEGAALLADTRQQLQRLEPASYRITLHSATLLPFKPQTKRAWDGFGGPVPKADDMLRSLATIAADPTGISAAIEASRLLSDATSSPDSYIVVVLNGQALTLPRQTTRRDTLQPVWDFSFPVYGANHQDQRVISVTVVDEDLEQDDTVGDFQMTVGDVVRQPVQEVSFIGPGGELRAGGVLVVKFTAEKL